ncbi:MAG: bifunctional demethylmenaquinone methyltransferase/2-methoxy-6-polyprenyl-1,4-benzoquinol methylase UbiE [Thermodesulfobacteriota bacterium]
MKTYTFNPRSIRNLFDHIAPKYDFLNHLLSVRRDFYWRKRAIQELKGYEGWILDIATGTADGALEMIRQEGSLSRVFGLDFSESMIRIAQKKINRKRLFHRIFLGLGDALALPFRDDTFVAAFIAFGLRNIIEKDMALSETVRVIKSGGKVVILEFTFPQKRPMSWFYPLYLKKILPLIGGLLSGNKGAYAYLPKSILHFQKAEDYERMMKSSGLIRVNSFSLTGGIVSIFSGTKP